MKKIYVYIICSKRNGTLYIGITSNLNRRIQEHKNDILGGFTSDYSVHQLVYYEIFETAAAAIHREKNIKAWKREWKLRLIEDLNPDWKDLSIEPLETILKNRTGSQPSLG